MSELEQCVKKNIDCPKIDEIVLVIETDQETPEIPRHRKVKTQYTSSRPTYTDMFRIANRFKGNLKIIANTDIYFDNVNLIKMQHTIEDGMCLALSRWDVAPEGTYTHHANRDSQDVWVFKGEISYEINGDFLMGKPGCDNRIAYEIKKAGYKVRNPSKNIRTYHLHNSDVRNYVRNDEHVVPMPYMLIPVTGIDDMTDGHWIMNESGLRSVGIKEDKPRISRSVDIENVDDRYTLKSQVEEINRLLLSRRIPKRYLWSIIILTTKSDFAKKKTEELVSELYRQINACDAGKRVQVYLESDNGMLPIGYKRNKANIRCQGRYVSHFDFDDWPAPTFVQDVLFALNTNLNTDCVTFNAELELENGGKETLVYHKSFDDNYHSVLPGDLIMRRRMISHINVMKREIQLKHPFHVIGKPSDGGREQRRDYGSDVEQSRAIHASGAVKKHVHIDKVLYYYRYTDKKDY